MNKDESKDRSVQLFESFRIATSSYPPAPKITYIGKEAGVACAQLMEQISQAIQEDKVHSVIPQNNHKNLKSKRHGR